MSTHQEQDTASSTARATMVTETDKGRRAFLARCGKFAVVTSPAVTLLLDTSMAAAHVKVSPGQKRHRRRRRRRRPHIIIKNNYYFYPPGGKSYDKW